MNYKNILKVSLAVLASVAVLAGCAKKEFEEITEITLSRCLEPQNLSARVDVATGDNVLFGWDVNKDAQLYLLTVYGDAELTNEVKNWELEPSAVPFLTRLTADQKYWFTVQAFRVDADGFRIEESASKIAVFDSESGIKTYAVKDNLFLELTGISENSVSLAWSKDVSDFEEVTDLQAVPVKGGKTVKKELSAAEKTAAAATIDGLEASTEYQITLFYLSASRGTKDVWTKAAQGSAVRISTSEELKSAAASGGEYYLAYSEAPYSMGTAAPSSSFSVVGELGPDGVRPVVSGSVALDNLNNASANIYFESITFDGGGTSSRLVDQTAKTTPVVGSIKYVNCGVTNYKCGFFYDANDDALVTISEFILESCDIWNVIGTGGDAFDIRKAADIKSIKFVNNTIYDGIRSFFRIDANDNIKLGTIEFSNNTVKNVATMDDSNNRGVFAIRVPYELILKNNLFLWEDTPGKEGQNADKKWLELAHLFQDNSNTVVPTLNASNNYSYAHGDAFFAKVSAADAGFTVMNVDPCYNSKGNFFNLAAQDLIEKQVGASKWWLSYVEKPEDLTQNVVSAPHVWNLQNATLFAGEVKNSRVRDELLLVGTEQTPLNADGGINFLSATVLSRRGMPEEGYAAFKIDAPGSVDILLADPAKAGGSVVIALADDNGLNVQGGAAVSSDGVQKILVPKVDGEGTIYIYALGAVSMTKLAWSADTKGGNKVLATPKLNVDPVTVMEGDETEIAVSWAEVEHAASYQLKFNKKTVELEEGALSYTVPAETIAGLKAGLYGFTIVAVPAEEDIYYVESETGMASIAIQPKGEEPQETIKTLTWDFTADFDAKIEVSDSQLYQYDGGAVSVVASPSATEALYFAPNGKKISNAEKACDADGITYHPITYGGGDAYMFVYTAKSGILRVTATVGKSVTETGACDIQIATGPEVVARKSLTTLGDKEALSCYDPSVAGMDAKTFEWEITNTDGTPKVIAITKPSGANSPWIFKVEFVYSEGGAAPAPVKYRWDFTPEYDTAKIEVSDSQLYQYDAGVATVVASPSATEALYFAPNGKKISHAEKLCDADGITYHPITYGGGDAYMFVYTAKSGILRVTATVGKSVTETGACDIQIATGPEVVARKSLTTLGDKEALSCYDPSVAGMDAKTFEWEITNTDGTPKVIAITKPSGANSPWIFAVEFEAN
ncbi:MAG: DUF4957 domain-containing protein [Bacteroidales bacterium]|nr:DUF4957 domain-containing protein [Bacteroidales bacterium]